MPADPARRCHDRWDWMARRFNDTVASDTGLFDSDRADHFQGAGDQLQLLRADFTEICHITTATRITGFGWLQPVYFAGEVFR